MSGAFIATELELPLFALVRVEIEAEMRDGRTVTRQLSAYVVRREPVGVGIEWHVLAPAMLADLLAVSTRAAPSGGAASSRTPLRDLDAPLATHNL